MTLHYMISCEGEEPSAPRYAMMRSDPRWRQRGGRHTMSMLQDLEYGGFPMIDSLWAIQEHGR
jgi:hypothetical protein